MALNADQKQANKEAKKIRYAAYSARRKAFMEAKDQAILAFQTSTSLLQERDDAEQRWNRAFIERDNESARIRAEIALLETKLNELSNTFNIPALSEKRRATNDAYYTAEKAVLDKVKADFSDIWDFPGEVAWSQRVKAQPVDTHA